jgi:hypothetical protein
MERQVSPVKQMLVSGWVKAGKGVYSHYSGGTIKKAQGGWQVSFEPDFIWQSLWVALERFEKVALN